MFCGSSGRQSAGVDGEPLLILASVNLWPLLTTPHSDVNQLMAARGKGSGFYDYDCAGQTTRALREERIAVFVEGPYTELRRQPAYDNPHNLSEDDPWNQLARAIDEFHRIRAGQIVISLIDFDELEMGIISEKGVRDFVSRQRIDAAVVFPGLLSGILKTGSKGIDDGKIVETARKINRQRARDKRPLSLFQNAHDLVARFLTD